MNAPLLVKTPFHTSSVSGATIYCEIELDDCLNPVPGKTRFFIMRQGSNLEIPCGDNLEQAMAELQRIDTEYSLEEEKAPSPEQATTQKSKGGSFKPPGM